MSNLHKPISSATTILQKYDLCDHCLGRLFSKAPRPSNSLLGKKIRHSLNHVTARSCYICRNLIDNLKPYIKLMLESSSKYDYSTFLIGIVIKPSIIDRDDCLRSKYQFRGTDSIKTSITKELSKQFIQKTKKRIDFLDPEITFTINFQEQICHIRSKSIYFQGRYNKTVRGIPQKQKPCTNCLGKGCRTCNYHGISEFCSIEGKISEFFYSKIGGTTTKFTWIGSEDKLSLVLGSGRPFFIKIQQPLKRHTRIPSKVHCGELSLFNCKQISTIPQIRSFISSVAIYIKTEDEITSKNLQNVKSLLTTPIKIYEKTGKYNERKIIHLRYRKTSKNRFILYVKFEGGLPIKRFVESNDVESSITQILKIPCTCLYFDFHDIEIS